MDKFFTKAFENAPEEVKESLYKHLFMHDNSDYSREIRTQYYKKVLRHLGENVEIDADVKIINPQWISIGDNCHIMGGTTMIARGERGITIGDNVWIKENVLLDTERADDGYINIENNVYIGTGTTLFGHVGLDIYEYSLLAQNITCTPYSHIFNDPEDMIIRQGGHTLPVKIGPDAYIGMGVDIMYTGSVGKGSVVGAGSVVVKEIPPYSVAIGNPAKVIKERK